VIPVGASMVVQQRFRRGQVRERNWFVQMQVQALVVVESEGVRCCVAMVVVSATVMAVLAHGCAEKMEAVLLAESGFAGAGVNEDGGVRSSMEMRWLLALAEKMNSRWFPAWRWCVVVRRRRRRHGAVAVVMEMVRRRKMVAPLLLQIGGAVAVGASPAMV